MSFRHLPEENRMTMDFPDGEVWVDYARQGDTLSLLHVEADPALRGSGAAGQFMQAVVDHARTDGLKLRPVCSYAVAWMKRHRDADDVAA
jgi:uncharacterized protein